MRPEPTGFGGSLVGDGGRDQKISETVLTDTRYEHGNKLPQNSISLPWLQPQEYEVDIVKRVLLTTVPKKDLSEPIWKR
jgi:hypothetical protein